MDIIRSRILADIETERAYQDGKWGHDFDDTHSPADWWTFVTFYYGRALKTWKVDKDTPYWYSKSDLRKGLVKVAAIIVAWMESLDRAIAAESSKS